MLTDEIMQMLIYNRIKKRFVIVVQLVMNELLSTLAV